eukprot:TRINITY_DN5258_c0_g2_i1.p1 TRINITY_DN5258_c0_g2~~TRINITY_DN5258_c0_g2_i1.p1  ORF type:complete len:379 (-),score=74.17 TRINITY_DN5258_c0_g2_i1:287-1423(-)
MADIITATINEFISFPSKLSHPTEESVIIWFTFWIYLAVTYYILPGKIMQGAKLKNGKTLDYKVNGLASFILMIILYYVGVYLKYYKATVIYDNFWPLFTVSNYFSFALVFFLVIKGKFFADLTHEHKHGNILEDIWYGVELNPRVLGFDFKYFSYRPLIMGWAMIILSMAHVQYDTYGRISVPFLLYFIFTWWYAIDYLWVEYKICTTWDILAENFGFGLTWGDHVFFPFFYSLHAHYLLVPFELEIWKVILIVLVFLFGYTIFRESNNQKDLFKRLGEKTFIWGKKVETTKDGRLLLSGWWSRLRHPNYLGDILISLGWALPCGIPSLAPWLHLLFFVPFLMHREYRDEKRMKEKYSAIYEDYCKRVKYRIFPFLY